MKKLILMTAIIATPAFAADITLDQQTPFCATAEHFDQLSSAAISGDEKMFTYLMETAQVCGTLPKGFSVTVVDLNIFSPSEFRVWHNGQPISGFTSVEYLRTD